MAEERGFQNLGHLLRVIVGPPERLGDDFINQAEERADP